MSRAFPHVQASTELLALLPQFRSGARFIVFACIGLFEADPLGASKRDILDYTQLSRPSVEDALRGLLLDELITFAPDTRRYRCARGWKCPSAERWDIHQVVPIPEAAPTSAKKVLATPSVVVGSSSRVSESAFPEQQQTWAAVKKVFAGTQPPVQEPALTHLAHSVALEHAQAWVAWLAEAPDSFRQPVSYMVSRLLKNPQEPVPAGQKRMAWYAGYDEFVER